VTGHEAPNWLAPRSPAESTGLVDSEPSNNLIAASIFQAPYSHAAETLAAIAGEPYMFDPTLRARLRELQTPVLGLWGESDRAMSVGYGRAFAAAIPGAELELIAEAGHLPQLEQPSETFLQIHAFLALI